MRKLFVYICLLCLLLPLNIAIEDASATHAQLETDQVIENDHAAQILAATVHIHISALIDEDFIATSGLATAVMQGQHISLITHNHWNSTDQTVGLVTMRNAGGDVLSRLRLPEFHQLIRYQDESVLILDINDQFKRELITPVQISAPVLPHIGAIVQLVRQHPDSNAGLSGPVHLVLNSAKVTAYSEREGLPVIELQIEEGGQMFHLGDSGGGIWFNGQLIAQIWRILMSTSPAELAASSGSEPLNSTRYGVAAQLPWRLNSWSNWQTAINIKDTAVLSPVKQPDARTRDLDERLQPNGSRG